MGFPAPRDSHEERYHFERVRNGIEGRKSGAPSSRTPRGKSSMVRELEYTSELPAGLQGTCVGTLPEKH